MIRLASALLLCLFVAPTAVAQDAKKAYEVKIVLRVAKHRLLTDVFRRKLNRELGDGLRAALGKLAKVTVVEKDDLAVYLEKRGLEKGLASHRELSNYKIHYVFVRYENGRYEIQARQHDGTLGLPGPVVRKDKTRDRAFVARVATLLIEKDLGLLGTILTEPDGKKQVKVQLRGGELGTNLGRWIKKGEVFALARSQAGTASLLLPATIAVVESAPKNGVCLCTVYSRHKIARYSGLKAVLLGTVRAPMRLRLMQLSKDGPGLEALAAPVTLQIRKRSFDGEASTLLELTGDGSQDVDTSRRGTKGRFSKVAFVSVLSGDKLKARIPIPIVDDRLEVLPIPPGSEEEDDAAFRYRALLRRAIDSYLVQVDLRQEINDLSGKAEQRAKAIKRVEETLERCTKDHDSLTTEMGKVAEMIKEVLKDKAPDMEPIRARLKLIKESEKELVKHIEILKKIDKEENDPKRKEWLVKLEKAKLLEKDAELGQAIAIYEGVPAEFKTDELKKHLAALKKLWDTADDDHKKAREFIYKSYPKLDTEGLSSKLKEAKEALDQCKKNNDLVGPTKMLKETEKHVQRIVKEASALQPEINSDDQKPAKLIKDLIPGLKQLETDLRAAVTKK